MHISYKLKQFKLLNNYKKSKSLIIGRYSICHGVCECVCGGRGAMYLLVWVCAHTCSGICGCTWVYVCAWKDQRLAVGAPQWPSPFSFWDKVSQWTWNSLTVRRTDRWASSCTIFTCPLPTTTQHWDYTGEPLCPVFDVGSRDPNSGPHACITDTLPAEPPHSLGTHKTKIMKVEMAPHCIIYTI